MKRAGLLALLVAVLGVTSLTAAPKGRGWGRGDRYGTGVYLGGYGRGGGLPPGLQRHIERTGQLPPGLQRHWERTGQLPPGLEKRRGGLFGLFDNGGWFGGAGQRGWGDRWSHGEFHQRFDEKHRQFHRRHPDLDDWQDREAHRWFHERQERDHRRSHERDFD